MQIEDVEDIININIKTWHTTYVNIVSVKFLRNIEKGINSRIEGA